MHGKLAPTPDKSPSWNSAFVFKFQRKKKPCVCVPFFSWYLLRSGPHFSSFSTTTTSSSHCLRWNAAMPSNPVAASVRTEGTFQLSQKIPCKEKTSWNLKIVRLHGELSWRPFDPCFFPPSLDFHSCGGPGVGR